MRCGVRSCARYWSPLVFVVLMFDLCTGQAAEVPCKEYKLKSPNASDGDRFGFSIDASQDTIAVGAPDVDRPLVQSGAVYVYHRTISGWGVPTELHASD